MLERKYLVHREKYRPDNVRVLFVAESPPTSGSYFYFPITNGRDHLFRETMRAVGYWKVGHPLRKGTDKQSLLSRFKKDGYFLVDVCGKPVDKMGGKRRTAHVKNGTEYLLSEIQKCEPRKILIIKSSIWPHVKNRLRKTVYFSVVCNKRRPIPFPSHGNQAEYRNRLRRYLSAK